jgi:uncharacterized protein
LFKQKLTSQELHRLETLHFDFTLMVVFGLASSLHCVTMCGPIIAVASAPLGSLTGKNRLVKPAVWQTCYHLGRGITYTAIGLFLAAIGVATGNLAPARFAGGILQIVVGAAIILMAFYAVFYRKAITAPTGTSFLSRLLRRYTTSGHATGMFILGLVTGFLPCGVLYAAFARALASASIWEGGWLMIAFWLGTTPLLFAVGYASGGFFQLIGKYAAVLLFIVMVVTGGWLMRKGYSNVMGKTMHSHSSTSVNNEFVDMILLT